MKYTFNEQQLKNLKVFLSRTQLQGSEAEALLDIMAVLNNPEKEEKKDDPK